MGAVASVPRRGPVCLTDVDTGDRYELPFEVFVNNDEFVLENVTFPANGRRSTAVVVSYGGTHQTPFPFAHGPREMDRKAGPPEGAKLNPDPLVIDHNIGKPYTGPGQYPMPYPLDPLVTVPARKQQAQGGPHPSPPLRLRGGTLFPYPVPASTPAGKSKSVETFDVDSVIQTMALHPQYHSGEQILFASVADVDVDASGKKEAGCPSKHTTRFSFAHSTEKTFFIRKTHFSRAQPEA